MALTIDEAAKLDGILREIQSEASEIRQDWSDPRMNLRAIGTLIATAKALLVELLGDANGVNA